MLFQYFLENQALLEQSERIERGTNRLREAQRVAIESEQIGADILGNLARDRESINRSSGFMTIRNSSYR